MTVCQEGDFEHSAVQEPPLGAKALPAQLNDSQRLSVLLQGAALLAHCERFSLRLEGAWETARASRGGLLCGLRVVPGASRAPAQELLLELLAQLFGSSSKVAGRGQARRAARELHGRWSQALVPLRARQLVSMLFEAADFLFEQRFASCRRSLLSWKSHDGRRRLFAVGPGSFLVRLERRCAGGEDAGQLVESPEMREMWGPVVSGLSPEQEAAKGRWSTAVAAWRNQPPHGQAQRLTYARCLYALGRFEKCLSEVRSVGRPLRVALEAQALYQLGRLDAAKRALRRLDADALEARELVRAADVAVRIYSNQGRAAGPLKWLSSAASLRQQPWKARGQLVAALAAWDAGDLAAVRSYLEQARSLRRRPRHSWRWHHVAGLEALSSGNGEGAVEHLTAALGARRRLCHFEAASLWNDLGLGRAQARDLAGAERAFRHAVSLLKEADSPRITTLALSNLAEVRVRRGRFAGVEESLQRSRRVNRRSKNWRGLVHDLELAARHLLGLGELSAALERVDEAERLLAQAGASWQLRELGVIRARALGWLGRPADAANTLSLLPKNAPGWLDEEERVPLLLLAGNYSGAYDFVGRGPLFELWRFWLASEEVPEAVWSQLGYLEPYRLARLVFDLEVLSSGRVGCTRRRWARQVMVGVGATGLARRLERASGFWNRLAETDLAAGRSLSQHALAELFTAAGAPEARLEWRSTESDLLPEPLHEGTVGLTLGLLPPSTRAWLAGSGGDQRLTCSNPTGHWTLDCASRSERVRAAFAWSVSVLGHEQLIESQEGKAETAKVPEAVGLTGRVRSLRPSDLAAANAIGEAQDCRGGGEPGGRRTPEQGLGADLGGSLGRPSGLSQGPYGMVGRSSCFLQAVERLDRLSAAEVPLLLSGESGTGKELFARRAHSMSCRRDGPFVPLNCAGVSESLILSDLFGHVRGAFTGADRDRQGLFEAGRLGTVFLDEIADLPLSAQGALLRVLEEREVRRVGATQARPVDVRVVAASYRDLDPLVAAGRFRGDLLFRLRVGQVELPPLRARSGDIELLVATFLAKRNFAFGLEPEALAALLAHDWPGNVRELRNVVEVAVALAVDRPLRARDLEIPQARRTERLAAGDADMDVAPVDEGSELAVSDYHSQIAALRSRLVREALESSNGNRAKAARRLGLSRQALSYLARELDV